MNTIIESYVNRMYISIHNLRVHFSDELNILGN